MNETVDLDDMRLFGALFHRPEPGGSTAPTSMSAAARALGLPKQTVSRRLERLSAAIGIELVRVTGGVLRPTPAGLAYAARCVEVARLAAEVNREAVDTARAIRGTLRLTADPVFGEAFLTPVLVEYVARYREVKLDVVLTRERVDLVREGFDVAFRVGSPVDASLHGARLGPATVRFCASAGWARSRTLPLDPEALAALDCLLVTSDASVDVRWPLPLTEAVSLRLVRARHRFTSLALALGAARAGLGVGMFPDFVCGAELRAGALVDVLGRGVEVGAVWLLHAHRRALPARVAAFVAIARQHFARAPWVEGAGPVLGPR